MRPSNKSRSRNKSGSNNNRRNVGNIVNRVFESAGPDSKVRGTPQQIIDKYQALARDAQVSGDRVAAESFLQHAEHYARLLSDALRAMNDGRERDDRDDRDEGSQRDDIRSDGREERRDDAQRPAHDPHDDGARAQPRGDGQRGNNGHRDEHGDRESRSSGDQGPPARTSLPEPSGLATFGEGDRDESGPVETPEEQARRRSEAADGSSVTPPDNGGDGSQADAPKKRTRTRRKAPAPQPAEASAD